MQSVSKTDFKKDHWSVGFLNVRTVAKIEHFAKNLAFSIHFECQVKSENRFSGFCFDEYPM